MIYLAFLFIVAMIVVAIVMAANGKLFKMVDGLRGMMDGTAAQGGAQKRWTTQNDGNNGGNGQALARRIDKLEETNRGLASYVDTLARTVNSQNGQICTMEKQIRSLERELSRLSAMSADGQSTGKTTNSPGANAATTSTLKTQQEDRWANKRNERLTHGKKFYVSSPSGVNPIRFALDDLSEQPHGYFYCLVVKSATRAVLQLNPDLETMKGFLSSLYYQTDCVDVLSRPDGIPASIETKKVGELELNGDSWILKQKIQIRIN